MVGYTQKAEARNQLRYIVHPWSPALLYLQAKTCEICKAPWQPEAISNKLPHLPTALGLILRLASRPRCVFGTKTGIKSGSVLSIIRYIYKWATPCQCGTGAWQKGQVDNRMEPVAICLIYFLYHWHQTGCADAPSRMQTHIFYRGLLPCFWTTTNQLLALLFAWPWGLH